MAERHATAALVSLGSNVTPELNLPRAVALLRGRFAVQAVSSAWETGAVGPPGQPPFLNAAVVIAAERPPQELRAALRDLEAALGRERTRDRFAPRPIDLDLVLYGDAALAEGGVRVPDPDLLRQAYLAVPAAEAAPEWRHPESGEPLRRIAERLLAALPPEQHPRRSTVQLGLATGG